MRNIIKVLLNEGIEREDVVAICKYIKEEYTDDELNGLTPKAKKWLLKTMNPETDKNGNVQLKTYSREDALKNAQAMSNQEIEKKNALKQGKQTFLKKHTQAEKPQEVVQRNLFG